jgi:dTMP kinase
MTSAPQEVVDVGTAPGARARALLRVRAYRRLWNTQLVSGVGDRLALLVLLALAFRAAAETEAFGGGYAGPLFALAAVLAVRLLATLLFGAVLLGPLTQLLTTRLDRRWTLLGCDLLRFALLAVAPYWIVWTRGGAVTWLLVTVFAAAAVERVWTAVKEASAPALLPSSHPVGGSEGPVRPSLEHLETLRSIDLWTGYAALPAAAALFVLLTLVDNAFATGIDWLHAHQTTAASWGAAALFLAAAVLLYRQELPVGKGAPGYPVRSPLQGLRAPTDSAGDGTPPLRKGRTGISAFCTFALAGAFAALAAAAAVALPQVYEMGAGPIGFGLFVLALAGTPLLGRRVGPSVLPVLSRRRLLPLALGSAGIALIIAGLTRDYVLALVLTTFAGLAAGVAIRAGRVLLDQETEEARRPKVAEHLHAVLRVACSAALVLAPLLAAGIGPQQFGSGSFDFDHGGAGLTVCVAGLLLVVLAVVVLLRIDDRRGTAPLHRDVWDALRGGPAAAPATAGTGYFIALEGGDGAGKSTQVQALAEWIRSKGHEVVVTREPGGSPVGQRLRAMLLDVGNTGISHRAEALLYAADRAEHVDSVIRPALERGAVVITDRYMDSSVAYQGAGRDLAAAEVARISRWATGGLVPDLTVLLDVDPETARERFTEAPDRMESESAEFHQRVRAGFLALAAADPTRYLVVDAGQAPYAVTTAVRHRLDRELPLSEQEKAAKAEQERLAAEEARRRAEEEARRKAEAEEAERKKKEMLERLRKEAEERERERQAEEDRRAAEAARLAAEEARRKAEEEARRRAEEQRQAEEARRRAEEEQRRRVEAEAARLAELERQRNEKRAEERRRAEEALRRAEQERAAAAAARAEEEDVTAELPQVSPDAATEEIPLPAAGEQPGDGAPSEQPAATEEPAEDATKVLPKVPASEETTRLRPIPGETQDAPESQEDERKGTGRKRGPRSRRPGAGSGADQAEDATTVLPKVPPVERTAPLPVVDPEAAPPEAAPPAEQTRPLPRVVGRPPEPGAGEDGEARLPRPASPEDRVPPGLWREDQPRRSRPEWAEETPLDDVPSLADELLGPRDQFAHWEDEPDDRR